MIFNGEVLIESMHGTQRQKANSRVRIVKIANALKVFHGED